MVSLRRVVVVPIAVVLALAAALPAGLPTAGAAEPHRAAYPETVKIHDSRTSAPVVDLSEVTLEASWYWDSQQNVYVTVPNGFRPGHRLTVYFDLNADAVPDGHFDLRLAPPKKKGGKWLVKKQEFRRGGGWDHAGTRARCGDSEGFPPVTDDLKKGSRKVSIGLDLWWCLGVPNPADSGSWRAAVRLAKGKQADMAPNGRRWSAYVAGWGPCDPSGGDCP